MTVGEYAGVPLQDVADTWRGGGIFLLRRPAARDSVVTLNGWTTSVSTGSKTVVTIGPSTATDHAGAFSDALLAANQGLDYMSATGQTHSVVSDATDDSILWWPDSAGGSVMRATFVIVTSFDMRFTGVVKDPSGHVVPQPAPPTPMAQNTFRFMRMAKTSGDLFDSYRNLFLAFECLLDDILPHAGGREGQWFKAALAAADAMVPVAKLAPTGEPDPIEWVYRNIYGDERSGLMHAKQFRTYLLPQDTTNRSALQVSLGTLWRYVRELIAAHLKVTSGSAHLSAHGWALAADSLLQAGAAFFVTNDDSPISTKDEPSALDPTSTTVELEPGASATDPNDPMLRFVSAAWPAAQLSEIDAIHRIGMKAPGRGSPIRAWSDLTGPLRLGNSVSTFEVLHGRRCVSVNGAPTVFSS